MVQGVLAETPLHPGYEWEEGPLLRTEPDRGGVRTTQTRVLPQQT